jgi:hypothetical protein
MRAHWKILPHPRPFIASSYFLTLPSQPSWDKTISPSPARQTCPTSGTVQVLLCRATTVALRVRSEALGILSTSDKPHFRIRRQSIRSADDGMSIRGVQRHRHTRHRYALWHEKKPKSSGRSAAASSTALTSPPFHSPRISIPIDLRSEGLLMAKNRRQTRRK